MKILVLIAILLCGFGAGCIEPSAGTSRQLGDVQYEVAFVEAKDVLSQYFSIKDSDPDTGIINCRPGKVQAGRERLLGSSAARHVAKMRLRREDGAIVAHLSIAIQRQGREGFGMGSLRRPGEDDYTGVPDHTPAEREGATTPEQNDVWQTQRQDKALEIEILSQLRERLHPIN